MVSLQHPIQVVARLTGLSPHVIRVWEKRYGAVKPARTDTNRRLYGDEDVDRLRLLAQATEAGHKIGIIARLAEADLRRLVATMAASGGAAPGGNGAGQTPERSGGGFGPGPRSGGGLANGEGQEWDRGVVEDLLAATCAFDGPRLQRGLERGAVRWGHNGVLRRVIGLLAQEIGERWQRGEMTAAQEHFASAGIRDFLMRFGRPYAIEASAPRAVVATPAGQLHELGAVMVSAVAANLGWRPVYLGASLPAAEIAGAAIQNEARVVLLSVVYPADDRQLPGDLLQLRRLLPATTDIVAGGRAARAYRTALREIGAIMPDGLDELCDLLEEMRDAGQES